MRRAEFECNDFDLIQTHLDEIPFGVMIAGQFHVADDLANKREILSALVAKYEPQSDNFSFEKSAFSGKENGVFVGLIEIESLSVKAKFGQNLKDSDFESILHTLQIRAQNSEIDKQTIALMKRFRKKVKF